MRNVKIAVASVLMVIAHAAVVSGCSRQSSSAAAQPPQNAASKTVASDASPADTTPLGDKWRQEFGVLPTQKGTTVVSGADGYVGGMPGELYDIALTPAEADWLSRKGFLGASERNRLSAMSEDELRSRSKQGDRSALLYLAEKLIDSGQGNTAASALRSFVNKDNSIPARYLLARYESQGISARNSAMPDPADSAAYQVWREEEPKRQAAASYLMQNYLLGDYRAGQMLYDLYPMKGSDAGSSDGIPPSVLTKALEAIQKARAANPMYAANYDPRPMPQGTFGRQSGQMVQ